MDILKGLIENIDLWQTVSFIVTAILGVTGFKLSKVKGVIKVLNDSLADDKISPEEFEKIFAKVKDVFK
jgi:hypothetical protein